MWLKFLLGALFLASLLGAFVFAPQREPSRITDDVDEGRGQNDKRLRLLTWNIGNGDLESETRAHTEDLAAVAKVILDNDPDAVALQELTGEVQLKLLLSHLKNRYRGYVCSPGSADRADAVLIKDNGGANVRSETGVRFNDVPAGDRFAAAATFRLDKNAPAIILVSAHADAFSASRRRAFVAEVVDWARGQEKSELAFCCGRFQFRSQHQKQDQPFH